MSSKKYLHKTITSVALVLPMIISTALFAPLPAHGQESNASTASSPLQKTKKRAIPRFVSLKKDRVNLRSGPSTTHKVDYVFTKKGLPVEIIAEFDLWRRIRDSEGDEGWVYHTLLSGTRTALIAPWDKGKTVDLFDSQDKNAMIVARAETGVLGTVLQCNGSKCLIIINDDIRGWVSQTALWGVYPDEKF